MSSFEVWLVRHGETEWSVSKRHTGRTDIPLTEHGEEEAAALAPALAGHEFGRVLCSPADPREGDLRRRRAPRRAELRDELLEWDYGDYEGKTTAEIHGGPQPGWLLGPTAVPVASRRMRLPPASTRSSRSCAGWTRTRSSSPTVTSCACSPRAGSSSRRSRASGWRWPRARSAGWGSSTSTR